MSRILLILCMVLMLVPATVFAETPKVKYSLTVKFEHGPLYGCTGSINKGDDYKTGDTYDIAYSSYDNLVDYAPYVVIEQKNFAGTFTDSDRVAEFIFAMPDYSIDIEVSGYKIGNTPADCKIENITSTIPDVSFDPEDKNDVLDIVWTDVDAGKTMSDTDVFQADKIYEIDVTLAKKGISVLPLATVNGKLCRHCREWYNNGFLVACYMDKPAEQYTITYDGGEGSECSIEAGTKKRGENFTLSSERFTREGYIQIGWEDKEGKRYELGGTYTQDADMTFYPIWDEILTLSVPFTTTVALGDAGEPGETSFELALIDGSGNDITYENEYFGAVVNTNGAGDYSGSLTITAPLSWFKDMILEGAFIWQYDDGEEGWTYDDTVWGVRLYQPEIAARSVSEVEYSLLIYPTYVMDDGSFNLDMNAGPVERMTFTNTYDAHAYELKHDSTYHWNECECGDKQNQELHKYGDWKVTKEATQTAKGEKEHTCTICGYTEKVEIAKLPAADTTDTTKNNPNTGAATNPNTGAATSPNTGDNSHMALWIALLFVSCGLMTAAGAYSRKKRTAR